MAAPAARGLFSKAITESAYMISTPELKQRSHGSPGAEQAGSYLSGVLKARPASPRCGRWMRRP